MQIEKMTAADLAQVLEIENASFSDPWNKNMFINELENKYAHYYTVKDNGRIVAYMGMYIVADDAQITDIAVHPQYRKKHIGSLILSHFIELAESQNVSVISLEVRKSNLAAIRLYEKFGFFPVGERKGYYTDNHEDAIIMLLKKGETNER